MLMVHLLGLKGRLRMVGLLFRIKYLWLKPQGASKHNPVTGSVTTPMYWGPALRSAELTQLALPW